MDHFPQILAHLSDPQVARLTIETHPPDLSMPVGPRLRNRPFDIQKRIVRRDAVFFSLRRMIHVDPQNASREIAQVLSGIVDVGPARPIP